MTGKEVHQKNLAVLLLVLAGFTLVGVLHSCDGPSAEDLQQAEYCRMVALYRDDPSTGWPDYEGSFRQHCTPEGKLKE